MANRQIKFPSPVLRLSLVWRGGQWIVENETRISSMTLPKSDELPKPAKSRGVTGFWYEAVDKRGRTIYRQVLDDPFAGMEVFDRDGKIRRIKTAAHEISIEVLIPDVPDLEELHIYSSTVPPEHGKEMPERPTAERVATLRLRDKRGGGYGRQ